MCNQRFSYFWGVQEIFSGNIEIIQEEKKEMTHFIYITLKVIT